MGNNRFEPEIQYNGMLEKHTCYKHNKIHSFKYNDRVFPGKIKYDKHGLYCEKYYENGKKHSFKDNEGNILPAIVLYNNDGSIKFKQYYNHNKLQPSIDRNGNIMPGSVKYGKCMSEMYYDDGKLQSFEDKDGNIMPATILISENNMISICYCNNDEFHSYKKIMENFYIHVLFIWKMVL